MLVYRRKRDAANPSRRGVWLGPGEAVAVERTSDKLVPRVVCVTVHGRLFLCSPEQLRPVSLKAAWVRSKLQEVGVSGQSTFQEMKLARGIDVRNERPSSAELEQERDTPEEQLVLEPLGAMAAGTSCAVAATYPALPLVLITAEITGLAFGTWWSVYAAPLGAAADTGTCGVGVGVNVVLSTHLSNTRCDRGPQRLAQGFHLGSAVVPAHTFCCNPSKGST